MNALTSVEIEMTTCGSCGIVFGMPDYMVKAKQENGGDFYCPNGHVLAWRETVVKKLRDSLAREETAHAQTRAALETAQRKVKRVEKGVCPHCQRSFQNVARHMKSKHAERCEKSK